MPYMNADEIRLAAAQLEQVRDAGSRAVLAKAVQLLHDLMSLADEVSDGWAYWPKPRRAARKLQELIQSGLPTSRNDFRPSKVTEAQLRAACAPIKAFVTREARNLQGRTLTFPVCIFTGKACPELNVGP